MKLKGTTALFMSYPSQTDLWSEILRALQVAAAPTRPWPVGKLEDQELTGDHDEREPGNENEANQGKQNEERERRPGLGIGVVVDLLSIWLAALMHDDRPPSLSRGTIAPRPI